LFEKWKGPLKGLLVQFHSRQSEPVQRLRQCSGNEVSTVAP